MNIITIKRLQVYGMFISGLTLGIQYNGQNYLNGFCIVVYFLFFEIHFYYRFEWGHKKGRQQFEAIFGKQGE